MPLLLAYPVLPEDRLLGSARCRAGARMPLCLALETLKPFANKHLGDVHHLCYAAAARAILGKVYWSGWGARGAVLLQQGGVSRFVLWNGT